MVEGSDSRLAIALDVNNLDLACGLADAVRPSMGVAKVGLELFAAVGPQAVTAMTQRGFEVFLDLKLHDIPTTVGRAAAQVGRTAIRWLTLHTSGGVDMLRAGVEGLSEASHGRAQVLGVTILTSEVDRSRGLLQERVGLARDAGCGGIICAASDIADAKEVAPDLALVVPGIRLAGAAHHDQVSVTTPERAIEAGACMLVVGRTVTASIQGLSPGSSQLSQALRNVAEVAALLAACIR
ncbi:MAG: orotidine-5'-phosphate decarboxylase [Acidimicrobiia bacterium]|nr:orotidine-5'-phosphate decarboxylase [Acidimicrobiia bacterium]MYC58385.1 orotidine-5'-phosphate decarboxylase [Acidimicrobiia bacterium]MYG94144.1 orotidine-5'-phosphate decarboxylase [Acidimicrobiia bacterium]MYI30509.1 orotidine-5'-phosphate decarboxylase [Acidimicrobiia bacterium]